MLAPGRGAMIRDVADERLEGERGKWAGKPGKGFRAAVPAKAKQLGGSEGTSGGVAYFSATRGGYAQEDALPGGEIDGDNDADKVV